MKITKRQLKRIIKEEKTKLHEQTRAQKEVSLLTDLDNIATAIEDLASGMYGLEDPADPDMGAGDEMAKDLELQVARLTDLYRALVSHFEQEDAARKEMMQK
mgnify:CR=1 FL=1